MIRERLKDGNIQGIKNNLVLDVCSAMMVELEITKMHNIDTVRRSSWEMIANYSKINFPNFFLFDFNFADYAVGNKGSAG